jgi:hypothetical protein
MLRVALPALLVVIAAGGSRLPLRPGYAETGRLKSPHATQAAAADRDAVYAVSSTAVAVHDRKTGQFLGTSTGKAEHLNSAFVWNGKVYCAHSNFPKTPETSEIRVFDPATRELTVLHDFKHPPGSLVWNVHDGRRWWCCFAHYGKAKNAKTVLVRYADGFREEARWTFPKAVVDDWDGMSASGGVWDGDTLLVTHHHWKVLYRLRLPRDGRELELVEALTCPFPGQGIAADPLTGGLVGIDRDARAIVLAMR